MTPGEDEEDEHEDAFQPLKMGKKFCESCVSSRDAFDELWNVEEK